MFINLLLIQLAGSNFFCTSGDVISVKFLCDNKPDCSDGSDEAPMARCFYCSDGNTISPTKVCDGFPDCSDGRDEIVEGCHGYIEPVVDCEKLRNCQNTSGDVC